MRGGKPGLLGLVLILSASMGTTVTRADASAEAGAQAASQTAPQRATHLLHHANKAPRPKVKKVKPNTGPVTGGTVVKVKGKHFKKAKKVLFGGVRGTKVAVKNDHKLTVVAPAHAAGTVDVVVVVKGRPSRAAPKDRFTYSGSTIPPGATAPTITLLAPTSGPAAGGTAVTITGSGFTGATAVTFGGTAAATFDVVSSTSITATSPAHSAGTAAVTVTTPGGTAAPATYTYTPPSGTTPIVVAVLPPVGSIAGGTAVTVTGTGFTGATSVSFGGSAATSVVVTSDNTITAVTPAHAQGLVDVTVANGAGPGTGIGLFTFVGLGGSMPTVLGVLPPVGSTAGGTAVTVTGIGFTGATGVSFGGTAATSVVVTSDNTITAVTPAHALGLVDVTVTNGSGPGTGIGLFTYLRAQLVRHRRWSQSRPRRGRPQAGRP
jgi:hypothetical protein